MKRYGICSILGKRYEHDGDRGGIAQFIKIGILLPVECIILYMSEPHPSDPDDFQQELEILRSILKENLQRSNQDPFLGTQLEFWMESARFLEMNIKIWDQAGNIYKENEARERMRKVLDILHQLINQRNDGTEDGKT